MACPNVTEEENCKLQSGCSESCTSDSSAKKGLALDHPVPVGTGVSGRYYRSSLQFRPALHCKQLELLENGVTSLQDNATPHHHRDVQNLVQCYGREVLAYSLYSPDLAPCDYWLFACVIELLRGEKDLNRKTISTLLSLTLYKVQPRMFIELQMIVHHVVGKVCG